MPGLRKQILQNISIQNNSRIFYMPFIFVYFVHSGFRTKIRCIRKVQSKSENPQRSVAVRKWLIKLYSKQWDTGRWSWHLQWSKFVKTFGHLKIAIAQTRGSGLLKLLFWVCLSRSTSASSPIFGQGPVFLVQKRTTNKGPRETSLWFRCPFVTEEFNNSIKHLAILGWKCLLHNKSQLSQGRKILRIMWKGPCPFALAQHTEKFGILPNVSSLCSSSVVVI